MKHTVYAIILSVLQFTFCPRLADSKIDLYISYNLIHAQAISQQFETILENKSTELQECYFIAEALFWRPKCLNSVTSWVFIIDFTLIWSSKLLISLKLKCLNICLFYGWYCKSITWCVICLQLTAKYLLPFVKQRKTCCFKLRYSHTLNYHISHLFFNDQRS